MEKPLNLKIREVTDQIADTINNAQLPAYILRPIIKDFYIQLQSLEQEELIKSKTEYENSLNIQNAEKSEE